MSALASLLATPRTQIAKVSSYAEPTGLFSGFPGGIESIEKVLNCEIGFEDLEKVLNLAKVYIKNWKSVEIPKFSHLFIQILFFAADDSFVNLVCKVFYA